MHCEDVRKQLAIDAQISRLSGAVKSHLLECPACRQAQALYAGIELGLRELPAWQPPPGFAGRVGLRGLASLGEMPSKPRLSRWGIGSAVAASLPSFLLGLLAAVFTLLVLLNQDALWTSCQQLTAASFKALLANAVPLAWITAILSLCFSAWFTRRVLR